MERELVAWFLFGLAALVGAIAAFVAAVTWHVQECRAWVEGMGGCEPYRRNLIEHGRRSRIGFLMPFLLFKRPPLAERSAERQ